MGSKLLDIGLGDDLFNLRSKANVTKTIIKNKKDASN